MTRHLSSDEVSLWILGEHSSPWEDHLRECSVCRADVTRLEQALAGYRGSVRAWSEGYASPAEIKPARLKEPPLGLRWAAVVTVLVMMVWFSLASRPDRPKVSASAESDAVLLNQIHTAVSRTVPGPMEPLTKLVTWDLRSDNSSRTPVEKE